MPLKQSSNALVTKLPFQQQDKPALGTARIGSLPPKNLGKSRGPPQNPAEPRRTLGDTPAEPPERQIPRSTEGLAEGCAPRMVTLRNFRILPFFCKDSVRLTFFRVPLIPFGNGQLSLIFGVPNYLRFFASNSSLNRQRTRSEKAQKLGTPKIRDNWPFPMTLEFFQKQTRVGGSGKLH